MGLADRGKGGGSGQGQESTPSVLVVISEGQQEADDFLYLLFHLPIAWWMVTRQEADSHTQEFKEGFPDMGDELGTPI